MARTLAEGTDITPRYAPATVCDAYLQLLAVVILPPPVWSQVAYPCCAMMCTAAHTWPSGLAVHCRACERLQLRPTPQSTANAYLAAWARQDWAAMRQLTSARRLQSVNQAAFAT